MSGAFEPPRAETRAATWLPKPTEKHKNLLRARWFIELLHGNALSARDPGNGTRNGRWGGGAQSRRTATRTIRNGPAIFMKLVGCQDRLVAEPGRWAALGLLSVQNIIRNDRARCIKILGGQTSAGAESGRWAVMVQLSVRMFKRNGPAILMNLLN